MIGASLGRDVDGHPIRSATGSSIEPGASIKHSHSSRYIVMAGTMSWVDASPGSGHRLAAVAGQRTFNRITINIGAITACMITNRTST
jgi:hypothetical protein